MKKTVINTISIRKTGLSKLVLLAVAFFFIFSCNDGFKNAISTENRFIDNEKILPDVSFAASSSVIINEEAEAHAIEITLSEPFNEVVSVSVIDTGSGSARADTDYNLTGWASPWIITFDPGETLKTVSITPVQDTIDEGAGETVVLELSSPVNASPGISLHEITILDDDVLPAVSFASESSATPDESANEHKVDIILSAAYGDTVSVTVTDACAGSAECGTDYNLTGWSSPEVITFDPGETLKTVSVTPVQDMIDEGAGETVILELSSSVNASPGVSSHEITITDDDDDWCHTDNISAPRAGAASAFHDGWLYVYGGEDYDGTRDDFWRYNLDSHEYEALTSYGYREYSTLVEINGKIYGFGGKDEYGELQDNKELHIFDISTKTWSTLTNSETNGLWPPVRYFHISVGIYDAGNGIESLYFHGGKDAAGKNMGSDLYELDLTSEPKPEWDSVSLVHTGDPYKRSEHSAILHDGDIYFFGGYDSDEGEYTKDLYKFDIVTEDFSEVITLGITIIPPRGGVQMVVNGGKFYVFGGRNTDEVLGDFWFYHTAPNKWIKISDPPIKRAFYSAAAYNESLFIYGGYSLNPSSQKIFGNELWQYNLD